MKGLKLSNTSWLILTAGVFIVVLAGLGLTRSQQVKEQTATQDELSLSETRLEKLQTAQLSQQLENLTANVEEKQARLKEAQASLHKTVISVEITDEFFKIAEYCGVDVMNLTTTPIAKSNYQGITCSAISLNANVEGVQANIINFIISLNNGFTTGKVQSAQIVLDETSQESESPESVKANASISMIIYSYEGQ